MWTRRCIRCIAEGVGGRTPGQRNLLTLTDGLQTSVTRERGEFYIYIIIYV